ncbi:hypothetical protein WT27_14800 [Burkholderia territorii]|uniref:Uncharacterized protein n=1 Tax=Burkholderia territorii TaxID=1503055 RepID=A0A105V0M5_9BURK|nr:hypothetical protein WT27_14800 [Burkholderia territorii]KVX26251.1 hypothetical protein WT31_16725 [Burkholderia territorii]
MLCRISIVGVHDDSQHDFVTERRICMSNYCLHSCWLRQFIGDTSDGRCDEMRELFFEQRVRARQKLMRSLQTLGHHAQSFSLALGVAGVPSII